MTIPRSSYAASSPISLRIDAGRIIRRLLLVVERSKSISLTFRTTKRLKQLSKDKQYPQNQASRRITVPLCAISGCSRVLWVSVVSSPDDSQVDCDLRGIFRELETMGILRLSILVIISEPWSARQINESIRFSCSSEMKPIQDWDTSRAGKISYTLWIGHPHFEAWRGLPRWTHRGSNNNMMIILSSWISSASHRCMGP